MSTTLVQLGFDPMKLLRNKNGGISAVSLQYEIARVLGIGAWPRRTFNDHAFMDRLLTAQRAHDIAEFPAHIVANASLNSDCAQRMADVIGLPLSQLWPAYDRNRSTHIANNVPTSQLSKVLRSARSFRLAIDALPVGKDIRARLTAHLDAHIADIHAFTQGRS